MCDIYLNAVKGKCHKLWHCFDNVFLKSCLLISLHYKHMTQIANPQLKFVMVFDKVFAIRNG